VSEAENLIEHLVRELDITASQAEGGAGLLLCFAQQSMSAADYEQIADAIPAISDIMNKAPRFEAKVTGPARAAISRAFGGLGGLTFLVGAFALLGLDKTKLPPFVAAMLSFFGQAGGAKVESLLRAVLR